MSDEEGPREEELANRQGTALYPVGRALRDTFDAENHDSLGNDLTGLMLELARIEPETVERVPAPLLPPVAPVPAAPVATSPQPAGWRAALGRLLSR